MALMVVLGANGTSLEQKFHALPLKAGRLLDYIMNDLHKPLSILSAHDTTCKSLKLAMNIPVIVNLSFNLEFQ